MQRFPGGRALALLLLLLAVPALAVAQSAKLAEFTVHAGAHERQDVPVTASLSGVPLQLATASLQLVEVTGGKEAPVASQVRAGTPDQLAWILSGATPAGSTRVFELRARAGAAADGGGPAVQVADDGDNLQLTVGGKPVLAYRYTAMPVPEGVRDVFSLSGFIHPLHSPQGEVLTRIQAPDHWHHYGIWNPWTHTEFEGDTVDFWNVGSRQGRVRSAGVVSRESGDVFGSFRSIHEHVAGNETSGEKVALDEQWEVTVWNAEPSQAAWIVDFSSTLSPASNSPLKILAYRYQGFSIRATEKWGDANSRLLTSDGMDKSNGNGTRARWIDVNGATSVPAGKSGILFMSNPGNYNHPEQLRIWPTGQNRGVENVFVNFNPAQEQDWLLEPGQTYGLKYRMFVYDGEMPAERAERLWRDYAEPPRVEVRALAPQ
jgi:hypothetical protein